MASDKKEKEKESFAVIASNRYARHEYFIEHVYEAGIELIGPEVKSIREGKVNLKEGYVRVLNGQIFLEGVHISPYLSASYQNAEPIRSRKLLMHKREILKLGQETKLKSMTIVPLRMYFKKGRIKLEIGLAKGKQLHDKRESVKNREAGREMDRANRQRRP